MGTGAAALAVACVVLGSPRTQDDLPRQRLFGVALRADRSPWVGAKVHACAAGPWTFAIGERDQVTAHTDARGRFHVEVLGGRRYSVWAEQALEDGTVLVSTDVRDGWAGERVELEATATAIAAPVLVLRELPSGLALPLRVVVRSAATGLVEEFLVDALDDGTAAQTLAASPRGNREVIVTDAAGRLVLSGSDEDQDPLLLRPAPARWLRIQVQDEKTKCGIAGADILGVAGREQVVLGSTDADGVGVFDASPLQARVGDSEAATRGSVIFITAPGFAFGVVDQSHALGYPTRAEARALSLREVVVRLRTEVSPPTSFRVRVGETPLDGARIFVLAGATQFTDEGAVIGGVVGLALVVDAAGVIELPGRSLPTQPFAGVRIRADLAMAVDATLLLRLPSSWRERLPAEVQFDLPVVETSSGPGRIDIDLLHDFRPVDVQVVAPDGRTPIAGVEVLYAPLSSLGRVPRRSDRLGRLRALVPMRSERPFVVATLGENGWCAVRLDPGEAPRDLNEVALVAVPLEAPLRIVARVLPGGLPRLPADLQVTAFLNTVAVRSVRRDSLEAARTTHPTVTPLEPLHQALLLRSLRLAPMRSGNSATIFIPALPAQITFNASGTLDGRPVTTCSIVRVEGDEGTVEFQLAFDQ